MSSTYTYTVEELEEAVKDSYSIRQVLIKLGIVAKGGNYKTVQRRIAKNNIDISHFKGKSWNKGVNLGHKRPVQDYLDNKFIIASYKLKKRLISEGYFEYKCSNCLLTEWLGNPIPLELEHIDGNSDNNSLENLKLLCPNCHTFTKTYRRPKENTVYKPKIVDKNYCIDCNTEIYKDSKRCGDCNRGLYPPPIHKKE